MADILLPENIVEDMIDNLLDNLSEANIPISESDATNALASTFNRFLDEKENSYDPSKEDNDRIIDDAIEILIERYGDNVWHSALREARELHLGSNAEWLYENMSQEIINETFDELKKTSSSEK